MGFFDMFRPRTQPIAGGVPGTAKVVSITPFEGSGEYRQARMSLVVSAPNLTPTAVEFDGLIHHELWPAVGATLPVSVNPNNPTRFAVLWEQVSTSREVAHTNAQSLAEAMSVDPSPLGAMISAAGSNAGIFTGADDRVSQLERLAALRDKGALTEAEFAAEKARILGG